MNLSSAKRRTTARADPPSTPIAQRELLLAALARRLAGARTVRFGFTPHNAPPATATFQVDGLERALASAGRECGWTR